MKLHTYYTYCPAHNGRHEPALLEAWHTAWSALGVECDTMQSADAHQHPYFQEFDSAISDLPSVNSKEYEAACFHRWLALAECGGGFMSDYDVFPTRHFKIEMLDTSGFDPSKLHIFQNLQICPSLVWCTPEVAVKFCHIFATLELGFREFGGRPHYSDMYALYDLFHAGSGLIVPHDLVRDYQGCPDWDKAALVHFNNSAMQSTGQIPKFLHIPKILDSI